MPLPLAFSRPPVLGVKNLERITEEAEDGDSTTLLLTSPSPKSKTFDYLSARPNSSNASSSRQENHGSFNDLHIAETHSNSSATINASIFADVHDLKIGQKQLIEAQQKQWQSIDDTIKIISQNMLSSKEELSSIYKAITKLQKNENETSKKSLDAIKENFQLLAEEVKSISVQQRETIADMKLSMDNERKSLLAQLCNERVISSRLRSELDNQIELQSMERKELDIEKEKLARQWKQLERSEALFEQRKMAASEGIEQAEMMLNLIRTGEAKLNTEMEHLVHLSNYVQEKDTKAQEQLELVRELTNNLQHSIDVTQDECFQTTAERDDRQQIVDCRAMLVRERVALLKERAKERELHRMSIPWDEVNY